MSLKCKALTVSLFLVFPLPVESNNLNNYDDNSAVSCSKDSPLLHKHAFKKRSRKAENHFSSFPRLFFPPHRLSSKGSAASDVEFVMWDSPVELNSGTDVTGETRRDQESEQQQEEEDEEGPEIEPRLKLPTQLKDLKVQVCHVISPSSFYVQFTENSRQLKRSVTGNFPNL